MKNEVKITLTEDEAWVLYELTRRFSATEKLSVQDQAEERALWNLCCAFEKRLHQESGAEYKDWIAECRQRLRDET